MMLRFYNILLYCGEEDCDGFGTTTISGSH